VKIASDCDFGSRVPARGSRGNKYPATIQLSRLVNSLKGRVVSHSEEENDPEVTQKLWGGHLWSPSYFAASCGGAPLEIIKSSTDNQRRA
jgi:putative transposase